MSAKDLIIDFINLVFIVILIGFFLVFFIVPENFAAFRETIIALSPGAFFMLVAMVKIKLVRQKLKRMKQNDDYNDEVILYLSHWDKLISEAVVFGTPVALSLLIYFVANKVVVIDVIIISLVFIIMYGWQKYLWSKQKI